MSKIKQFYTKNLPFLQKIGLFESVLHLHDWITPYITKKSKNGKIKDLL